MIKEGLFLSALMLFYTIFCIGLTITNIGNTFSYASILKTVAYGIPAVLMLLVPFGARETNTYWKLLGLSMLTYIIGNVSSVVIIYSILSIRLIIEGLAFYGFYKNLNLLNSKPTQ